MANGSESGLVFCPSCGNILLLRHSLSESMRFWCRTCPFVFKLEDNRLCISEDLSRKKGEDVLGGADAWKDVARTDARCPSETCSERMAYFRQMQIRSADEPMTTFYRCVACGKQWKED